MPDLTQQQGLLLATIARTPEASKSFHREMAGASEFSSNTYKLREHGLVVKNPKSGVAKRNGNYIEYQPERKEMFAEKETDNLKLKIIEKLDDLGGEAESVTKLAEEMGETYQKIQRRVNDLTDENVLEKGYEGNSRSVKLLKKDTEFLEELEYDIYMITGKGCQALKEFIENQPPIMQDHLKAIYDERIVYAPKHCEEKIPEKR